MKRFLLCLVPATLALACGGGETDAGLPTPTVPTPAVSVEKEDIAFTLETDEVSIPPGTETQMCYFFQVPGDSDQWINRIVATQTAGSHHLNVFRVKTIKDLSGKPGEKVVDGACWKSVNWADWPLVINSQEEGDVDWTLPDGVAHKFEPGEMIMLQSHYVNASTQKTPGTAKATIRFDRAPKDKPQQELGTAFASNQNIQVCPGQVDASVAASCTIAGTEPVTIVGANGHFHSRGREFTMSLFDPQSGASDTPFYLNKSWAEPLMQRGMSVVVPPKGGFQYKCEYDVPSDSCGDPTKMCCFTFGPKVEVNEHCNAFVYYYPKGASDVRCF
jgi:hypothetical protein